MWHTKHNKMSVCITCTMQDISSTVCQICLDNKTYFHTCQTCNASTCFDCVNGFAKVCYDYGREPSCSFCRAPVKLHDVWNVALSIWRNYQEQQVGEKRSRDDDSEVALTWIQEPIPPVSWRTYFQCSERAPLIPPPNLNMDAVFMDYLPELIDLTALDDPVFFAETLGMLPLPDENGWRLGRRDARRTRRRMEAGNLSPNTRQLYCSESSMSSC